LGAVVSSFDRSDLLVLIGLTLVGAGAWHISKPIAAIVVGAVVLWYGMPSRPPFIGGSK
jgi:hypothetical protein